jgi:hypothetical protein
MKTEKILKSFKRQCEKTSETIKAFRKSCEGSYQDFKTYLGSEQFEQHLNQFAEEVGIKFDSQFSKSKIRKIRITAKLKIVREYCTKETLKTSAEAGAYAAFFGPKAVPIGFVAGGIAQAGFFVLMASHICKSEPEFAYEPV